MHETANPSEDVNEPKGSGSQPPNGGNDAVCFTAGFTGAMFGAGTIHAYLAADREPPAVVAGISAGAINAAALQRCYQELKRSHSTGENREASRWSWFREYLSSLTDDPLGVVWRGLPRLTDFSADLPPVQDTSIGTLSSDQETTDFWTDQEKRARRELFLIMRLGDWLSRLPLKISLLATTIVNYVRLTEKIPDWRSWCSFKYFFLKMYVGLVLVVHTAFHPFWFKESRFKTTSKADIRFFEPSYWLRPLLGWRIYFFAWMTLLILTEMVLGIVLLIPIKSAVENLYLARAMEILAAIALAILYVQRRPIQEAIWRSLLPIVQSHARRILLAAFLAAAETALVIFYTHVLDSPHLRDRSLQSWGYTIFLAALFVGVAFLVVFVFEIVVTIATIGQTARTWLDQCENRTLWCVSLIGAEALSIFASLYLVRNLIFRALFAVLALVGGTVLLSLLAHKTLPPLRAFAKEHLHPVVAFMLQAPWTATGAVAQACCLVFMIFSKYRLWTTTGFVMLLGFESIAIAVKVILGDKTQKSDEGPAVKKTIKNRIGRWVSTQVFRNLEMERALVHRFQLLLRLTCLFGRNGQSDLLTEAPMPLVIVAAPLQTMRVGATRRGVSQVWAKPGIKIVDALAAAVALPGLYEPLHFDRQQFPEDAKDIKNWEMDEPPSILDLVDGAKIRQNPLPALFQFLRAPGREALAQRLSSTSNDPRIHAVFTVPIGEHEGSLKPEPLGVNIVDVALASARLNRRRDSELELEQTNFMSALELALQRYGREGPIDRGGRQKLYPIFADAISPEHDLTFRNRFRPEADEVLTMVASGCRRTLETIYKDELRTFQPGLPEVSCREFLPTIARSRQLGANGPGTAGLPEVCGTCACKLRKCAASASDDTKKEDLQRFAHLNGTTPRIVFLASGGVFRGAFHAGMLACLLSSDIRPDVIVGASVGTLMGGALGALLTARNSGGKMDYSVSLRLLSELVDALFHVDQRVAFTKVLKTAVRDFGIRARSVRLSPSQIRRMVKRGSRRDPGYAATGAPPAMIDGISNLLFIPHRATASIAAQFVAGHVTQAAKKLLKEMQKETLKRLDVEYALMGVSLLEPMARRLLGADCGILLDIPQPFLEDHIALFATTTNLQNETTFLLGRELIGEGASFDFVQGTLASSAFPAIFAPRRESDIFPGTGRTDVLFSDGGMFDNLPFIPTIELMAAVQHAYFESVCQRDVGRPFGCSDFTPMSFLALRHAAPDLFIAGSLNIPPEEDEYHDGDFDDLLTIHRRASSLQDNIKIRAFQEAGDAIHDQVALLVEKVDKKISFDQETKKLINGIVEAQILPVFPIDRDHLNPTFAFCASIGLKKERVERSIVNGCFQTFAALANAQLPEPAPELRQAKRSIDVLVKPTMFSGQTRPSRIPLIAWRHAGKKKPDGTCPYFTHSRPPRKPRAPGENSFEDYEEPQIFKCPFFDAIEAKGCKNANELRTLYRVCCEDSEQRRAHKRNTGKAMALK
jgi:predicted acylesterase/phospholipase RssA